MSQTENPKIAKFGSKQETYQRRRDNDQNLALRAKWDTEKSLINKIKDSQ
ncbi:MAG: hypothetical protein HY219_01730 [Candidatus Staskawiczbacteria bacterium]|nr:hypothetical protein [Candidatus Staskawiczbacteria bacterium]